MGADPEKFELSLALNLSAEDHLVLHGMKINLVKNKKLAQRYEEMQIVQSSPGIETDFGEMENEIESEGDGAESTDSAQKTLDFF